MEQWWDESTLEIAYSAPQFKILPWTSARFFLVEWEKQYKTKRQNY